MNPLDPLQMTPSLLTSERAYVCCGIELTTSGSSRHVRKIARTRRSFWRGALRYQALEIAKSAKNGFSFRRV